MSVTPADVAAALGRPTPDLLTLDQWVMWIGDARMLIEARLGDLDELDQSRLDYVVREAVVAQVRRPDDATQVAVSVDDGSVSRTYRSSTGRVTIRDEWWSLLSDESKGSGAFSIIPSGGSTVHLPWCSLMLGATYCSCGAGIAGYPIYEDAGEW